MKEAKFGPVTIVHDDNLRDMYEQKTNSWDFVYFDPIFSKGMEFLAPRLDEATRIVRPGGNIALLEKPRMILEMSHYIKTQQEIEDSTVGNGQSWRNMREMETISIPANIALPLPQQVASSTRMYHMVSKGYSERMWYGNVGVTPGRIIVDTDVQGLTTDNWCYKRFKGGTKRKIDGKWIKHSSSSPEWAVEKLLSLYIRKKHRVYDAFGGGGRIAEVCYKYNIECRCIEIEEAYFKNICTIMKKVASINERNRVFASVAVKLTKKADKEYGSKNRDTRELERCIQRSSDNRRKDTKTEQRT